MLLCNELKEQNLFFKATSKILRERECYKVVTTGRFYFNFKKQDYQVFKLDKTATF